MRFLIAAGLAVVAAAVFFFTLGWRSRPRIVAWCFCFAIVASSPALIELTDRDDSIQRLLASLLSVALIVKLYDVLWNPDQFRSRGFPFYAAWLANWLWLVIRRVPPARDRATDVRQVFISAALSLAGVALLMSVFTIDWKPRPFALEHSTKAATIFALLMPLTALASAAWRLFFGPAMEAMEAPFLARTPAEFWRQWNLPAQQFLATYVFEPAGGTRHPIRATLLTFFVSGVIHEYLFGIATGRVQGWQLLFFLTQGCAVAATSRWRPRGLTAVLGFALTIAFNLGTSAWFFRSIAATLPFYAER